MKGLTIVLLVVLLGVMAAVPAQADKPLRVVEDDYDLTFEVVDCGGYQVMDRAAGHASYTFNPDDKGFWKLEWHNRGVDHMFSSAAPDAVVEGHYGFGCTARGHDFWGEEPLLIDKCKCHGVIWNIQMPGIGTVYHESRMWQSEGYWTDGGDVPIRHAGLSQTDQETLCRAFAP